MESLVRLADECRLIIEKYTDNLCAGETRRICDGYDAVLRSHFTLFLFGYLLPYPG